MHVVFITKHFHTTVHGKWQLNTTFGCPLYFTVVLICLASAVLYCTQQNV